VWLGEWFEIEPHQLGEAVDSGEDRNPADQLDILDHNQLVDHVADPIAIGIRQPATAMIETSQYIALQSVSLT
jgi:hypothetical protein